MANSHFSRIGDRTVEPVETDIPGWKKVEGNPTMRAWREYTSEDESIRCGWWEATPGTYHATYEAWEFVHLIEGKITITPDGGTPQNVGAGDAFVIEKGFKGTWKIEEKALKHFVFKVK